MRSVDEDRILIFVLFFNFHFETEWKLTTPMSPTSRHSSTSPYHPAEGNGVDGCELDVIGVWWQLKLNPVAMRYKNKNTHIALWCHRVNYCFIHFSCFRYELNSVRHLHFLVNSCDVCVIQRQFTRKFIDQHSTFRVVTKATYATKMLIANIKWNPFHKT